MRNSRQRARRARQLEAFEVFNKAFTRSRPVRRALRDGYLSVEHPERALRSLNDERLAALHAKSREQEEARVHGVPPELLEVLAKQCKKDGKWPTGDARLEEILGSGHGVPSPPDGIVAWKWTLALCVAFLRRHAAHFEHVHDAHERAMFYLSDHTLLEKAKASLPPSGLGIEINADLVRQGRWRDAVDQVLKTHGHVPFVASGKATDMSSMEAEDTGHDAPNDRGEELVDSARKPRSRDGLDERDIRRALFRAKVLHDMGMAKFKVSEAVDFRSGRETAILNASGPLEEALPAYSTLADRLAAENERDMGRLQDEVARSNALIVQDLDQSYKDPARAKILEEQNSDYDGEGQDPASGNPLKIVDEELLASMRGLVASGVRDESALVDDLVRHEASLAEELSLLRRRDGLGAVQAAGALKQHWAKPLRPKAEKKRLMKATRPVPRPEWTLRDGQSEGGPATRERTRRASRSRVRRRSSTVDPARDVDSVPVEDARQEPEQDLALNERLRRERLGDQVQRKLQTSIKRAILYVRLVESLKSTVKENARQYRDAETHAGRNHAFDKTTRIVGELRLATCSLVEGIEQWRNARNELAKSQDESHVPQAYPFIWDGGNLVVRMMDCLDFLGSYRELVQWYGDAMPFRRNPFMLAVPIEERPVSPRQATRRVLVDGKQVLRVSEKLAALREQEVARMDAAWARVGSGPSWWPRCSRDEWIRVRAAEKVISHEFKEHSRLRARLVGDIGVVQ